MPAAFEKENKQGLSVFLLLFPSSLAEGGDFGGDFSVHNHTWRWFFFCSPKCPCLPQTVTDACLAGKLSKYWYGCTNLSQALKVQLSIISAFSVSLDWFISNLIFFFFLFLPPSPIWLLTTQGGFVCAVTQSWGLEIKVQHPPLLQKLLLPIAPPFFPFSSNYPLGANSLLCCCQHPLRPQCSEG